MFPKKWNKISLRLETDIAAGIRCVKERCFPSLPQLQLICKYT